MNNLSLALTGIALLLLGWAGQAPAFQEVISGANPTPRLKPARIALVASAGKDAVRNLLDLAQAKLTAAKNIELLERAAIGRVLDEQKLSLAGVVNAATAVQAGKLLGADLFAVVETAANDKEALGLVVYVAATGIKLWDKALAGGGLDKEAESLAAGVRSAAVKWAFGLAKIKTVCFLAVRNADLPAEKDTFCQALADILERRLVNSAAAAVLERKRLDFVNQEKALVQKSAYKDLLASLVLIDLEISRAAERDGLKVLALLTDRQGKQIARLTVQSKEANVADLAGPLLEQINKALAISLPAGAADLVREGKRFAREARLLLSHNHYMRALRAAESAFALAPGEPEHAALLSQCLTTAAIYLANPAGMRTRYYGKHLIAVKPDQLKSSLRLARRGFEIRANTLANLQPRTLQTLGKDRNINILTTDTQSFFRNHLPFYDPAAFDPEAEELRREFLAASNYLVVAEVNAWADIARADPAGFSPYTLNLLQRFAIIHEEAASSQEFTARIDKLVRTWLRIAENQEPGKMEPGYLTWFLGELERFTLHPFPVRWQFRPEERDTLLDLFKAMERHPQPLIVLCGRHGQLELRLQGKQTGAAEAAKEFHQIVDAALELISAPPPWFSTEYRVGCYKLVTGFIDRSTLHRYSAVRCADLFALCAFMLERGEILYEVIQQALVEGVYPKGEQKKRLELIQRALDLADSPRCRFLQKGQEAWIKRQLLVAWQQVLTAEPELRAQIPLPWQRVRTLLDLSKDDGQARLHAVKVVGSQVYAATCGFEKDRTPFVQIVRVAAPDGAPQFLAKAPVQLPAIPGAGRHSEGSWINFITGLVVGKDTAYVGTQSDGIYAFPLSGGPARRIGTKQGLPVEGISALALLDEKLYAGLKNGYFIAFDPAGEHCTVLASSQRKEKLTPFDDGSAFSIPYLVADPPRQRVLFILYQGIPSSANRTDGLWEYSAKNQTFTKRLALWRHANLNEGTGSRGGRIVISGFVATYLVSFDLQTNKASLLSDAYPIGPDLKTPDLQKRAEAFGAHPYLCLDRWVWTASPFSRKSVDGTRREIFPPLGAQQAWTTNPFTPRWLERIDSSSWVMIGDSAALWVVELRQGALSN